MGETGEWAGAAAERALVRTTQAGLRPLQPGAPGALRIGRAASLPPGLGRRLHRAAADAAAPGPSRCHLCDEPEPGKPGRGLLGAAALPIRARAVRVLGPLGRG